MKIRTFYLLPIAVLLLCSQEFPFDGGNAANIALVTASTGKPDTKEYAGPQTDDWTGWESLTEEAFKQIFRHSPLKRAKFQGIQRNIKFLKSE